MTFATSRSYVTALWRRITGSELDSSDQPESGQIAPLIIGFVMLTLLVTSVVAGVTSVYIQEQKLLSLADSAALAGASTYELDGSGTTTAAIPTLDSATVNATVRDYLSKVGDRAGVDGVTVGGATGTVDGQSAVVELHGVAHPPIINLIVPDGVPISVTTDARAQLRQ